MSWTLSSFTRKTLCRKGDGTNSKTSSRNHSWPASTEGGVLSKRRLILTPQDTSLGSWWEWGRRWGFLSPEMECLCKQHIGLWSPTLSSLLTPQTSPQTSLGREEGYPGCVLPAFQHKAWSFTSCSPYSHLVHSWNQGICQKMSASLERHFFWTSQSWVF